MRASGGAAPPPLLTCGHRAWELKHLIGASIDPISVHSISRLRKKARYCLRFRGTLGLSATLAFSPWDFVIALLDVPDSRKDWRLPCLALWPLGCGRPLARVQRRPCALTFTQEESQRSRSHIGKLR